MARSNEKPNQNETKMNQMKMKFKHLLKIKRFLETIKMCQLQRLAFQSLEFGNESNNRNSLST